MRTTSGQRRQMSFVYFRPRPKLSVTHSHSLSPLNRLLRLIPTVWSPLNAPPPPDSGSKSPATPRSHVSHGHPHELRARPGPEFTLTLRAILECVWPSPKGLVLHVVLTSPPLWMSANTTEAPRRTCVQSKAVASHAHSKMNGRPRWWECPDAPHKSAGSHRNLLRKAGGVRYVEFEIDHLLSGQTRLAMFTIITSGQTTLLHQFGALSDEVASLLVSVVPDAQLPPASDRPFVQFTRSEIADEDVERALGYAGITKANAPVGIPAPTEPRAVGRDFLIFSLSSLDAHLRETALDTITECERAGGFPAFVESSEISAFEYLVAGLVECIRWCETHRAALSIRW